MGSTSILYPVLTFEYPEKIARDWNSVRENHGFVGFVVRFRIDDAYAVRFQAQNVGEHDCQELWVPAEQLDEFNQHVIGAIDVVAEYRNGAYVDNGRQKEK